MNRDIKSTLLASAFCGLLAVLALPAAASAFAPYRVPAHAPAIRSAHVRTLLRGSRLTNKQGWIVVRLSGAPYKVGFQNGFLTAQSTHYCIVDYIGARGSGSRKRSERVARVVWPKVPHEYQREMRGIADGLHAAGYRGDSLWDVVAANGWADRNCYESVLRGHAAKEARTSSSILRRGAKGGCSAFIATGTATSDGLPVMGHNTWAGIQDEFMNDIIFYVHPSHGFDLCYQSTGGQIWSGNDWYENSAGLLLTETTLAGSVHDPKGTPVFVRAREAAQYDRTVRQCVRTLLRHNNGAYSNEWLIGDASGTIASLQLGCHAHDLTVTRNGFFGSSNFDWGAKTRAEERSNADPYKPAGVDYARYLRWGQLRTQYYGRIDAAVGRGLEADTYDSYLGETRPDGRTICGEPENATPGLLAWDHWVLSPCGATDAKVCTEAMAIHGLKLWARWGHPSGDSFDATRFLACRPKWAANHGRFAVFGLRTFAAQTPQPWTLVERR